MKNHNPTCGLIVKIFVKSDFQRLGDCWIIWSFPKKFPTFPPVVLWPVSLQGLRLGRFQRVSKRRHGWGAGGVEGHGRWSQTDLSGNPTHWWNGPSLGTVFEGWSGMGWMMNIVIGRYTPRHLTRGFCSLNSRNYFIFFWGGIGPKDSTLIAFLEHWVKPQLSVVYLIYGSFVGATILDNHPLWDGVEEEGCWKGFSNMRFEELWGWRNMIYTPVN